MSNADDRRHFHRILFDAEVRLNDDGHGWQAKLIDISMKGVLMECPAEWSGAKGDHFTLEIPLGEGGEAIRMAALLAHAERGHLGFEWQDIDVESFSHLRRLLELNLGDPNLVNRELSELSGQLAD